MEIGKLENVKRRNWVGNLGIDMRILLKCILRKTVMECGLTASGSGQDPMAGCCEHGNDSDSIQEGEIFDQVSDC
jgi:hypothetical protein